MCLICTVYSGQEARKGSFDGRGEEALSGEQIEQTLVVQKVDGTWGKNTKKKEVRKLQRVERFKRGLG